MIPAVALIDNGKTLVYTTNASRGSSGSLYLKSAIAGVISGRG